MSGAGPSGADAGWRIPEPWGRRLRLLPCAILIGVALHQIVLSQATGLSAWSGGGFGMFSTTDAGGARHLHAFLIRPGVVREVQPPRSLEGLVRRSLAHPTDARLRALARELARVPTPDHGPATGVRVQVWTPRFDPETLAPTGRILGAVELSLEGS